MESAGQSWRLVPLCIYSNGKYYDADFYQSSPVPMSLIDGTIYEVQNSGTPVGNFTVSGAMHAGSVWYGAGKFDDFSQRATKSDTAKSEVSIGGSSSREDDRPVLKRSTPAPSPTPSSSTTPTPTKSDEQVANNDPDRPTLKRGAQPQPPAPAPEAKTSAKPARQELHVLKVAVSDASQPQGRPFEFQWEPAQKASAEANIKKMAEAELRKNARERGITLGPKDKVEFADFDFRAFDVDYSNNPQIVVAAKFIPTQKQIPSLSPASQADVLVRGFLVTMVARVNYDGQMERIYGEVSDPRDLDNNPEMRLVDAVDVDSDNRAELVFVLNTDAGRRFGIYRLYGLSMNEVFTTAVR